MFKKLMDAQKKHEEKYTALAHENAAKIEVKMEEQYRSAVEDLLLEGEEIRKIYGLVKDFACITNERLIFVDSKGMNASGKNRRDIVFVFLKHVQEVSIEQGIFMGEVHISTSRKEYELKMIDKTMALRFAKELNQSMRNI